MEIALFFLQVEDTFSKTSKYHNFIVNLTIHTVPNCSILSNNKYNPGQLIQNQGFWLSSRPFWIRITFIWVHQGPPVIVLIFFFYYCYYIEFSNMESKPNFAKVHGPWWTQIKVVLIQKGLMDNQNPGFCMGWPGLYYLLDNINQLGSLCPGLRHRRRLRLLDSGRNFAILSDSEFKSRTKMKPGM